MRYQLDIESLTSRYCLCSYSQNLVVFGGTVIFPHSTAELFSGPHGILRSILPASSTRIQLQLRRQKASLLQGNDPCLGLWACQGVTLDRISSQGSPLDLHLD